MSALFTRPAVAAVLCTFCGRLAAAELLPVETTLVDAGVIHFGTFQSHNQKVVRNARGIFMTHVRTRNEKYTSQQWRLSWSRDGGKTFETLFEATDATNPPVLETDCAANLYLGRPDFVSFDVVLYRFLAAEDYRTPHVTRVPKSSAGKYAMAMDEKRGQVYYLSHSGMFIRFGLDGSVRSAKLLLKRGASAVQEYPHLNLDARGVLHAAWTTFSVPKRVYWSIHHLQSPDGGVTWQTFAGRQTPAPLAADETGPADRITLDDEFDVSTWLANFRVKDGKAHFLYLARTKPLRQHHVRYDIATGKRDFDHQPGFHGERLAIRGLDGFFATRSDVPGSTLYCVSGDERGTRVVCLVSDDNGATWRDHAASAPFRQTYAIGGCREVTPDGWIIGSFTEAINVKMDGPFESRVYFFRIPARRATSGKGHGHEESAQATRTAP